MKEVSSYAPCTLPLFSTAAFSCLLLHVEADAKRAANELTYASVCARIQIGTAHKEMTCTCQRSTLALCVI